MSFKTVAHKNPSRSRVLVDKDASTAIVKGTVIVKSGSLSAPATNTATRSEIKGIATESITALDAKTQVGVEQIFSNNTYVADTTNNTNVAHNNQRMVLSSAGIVNNTGTDNANGVVEQLAVIGEAADKKILVQFV